MNHVINEQFDVCQGHPDNRGNMSIIIIIIKHFLTFIFKHHESRLRVVKFRDKLPIFRKYLASAAKTKVNGV